MASLLSPFTRRPGFDDGEDLAPQTMSELLTESGAGRHFQVRAAAPAEKAKPVRVPVPPRHGYRGAYGGRSPVLLRNRSYRGSTAGVQGLYPWLHQPALPPVGAQIGLNMHTQSSFSCHFFEWIRMGLMTNPNVCVTGRPGVGKSAWLKLLCLRLAPYGVKSLIAGDTKNEYSLLARAMGIDPVELGPGLFNRLNPLDSGHLGAHLPKDREGLLVALQTIETRRISLLKALIETRLGAPGAVGPTWEAALGHVLRDITGHAAASTVLVDPTLIDVHQLLRDPSPELISQLRLTGWDDLSTAGAVATAAQHVRDELRPMTDALGNLLDGSLAGIFRTAPPRPAWTSTPPSRPWTCPASTPAGTRPPSRWPCSCVSSWAQSAIDEVDGPPRMIIRDEVWRQLRIPAMVAKIDADLRLSRKDGCVQVLATHELADFDAAGDTASAESKTARGLINKCDVKIVCPQDTKPLEALGDSMGLSDSEVAEVGSWSGEAYKGYALWQIASGGSHVVKANADRDRAGAVPHQQQDEGLTWAPAPRPASPWAPAPRPASPWTPRSTSRSPPLAAGSCASAVCSPTSPRPSSPLRRGPPVYRRRSGRPDR